MKLKLSQIIGSKEALQRLGGERFPANIAYRIQRNIKAISPEAVAFEKARDDLIKNKYGEPLEGKPDHFSLKDPEKLKLFTEEISNLLDEEVDIQIMTLNLDILHDITPLDLLAIEYMVEIPAEDPPKKPARPRARAGKGG
jgi:hypothetical protein